MKSVLFDDGILLEYLKQHKIPAFRVKQIFHEIYKNQQIEISEMTTLSKDLRLQLQRDFDVISLEVEQIVEWSDTTKFAFRTVNGSVMEAILMYHRQPAKHAKENKPKLNRITLCISSQVGCAMDCIFCVTGKLGFKKNLSWQEMISQILYANNYIKKRFGKKEDWTLWSVRNIVFMGMGEPLLNYEHMKTSIEIMLRQDRFSLSKRHITISTCGIVPWIDRLVADGIDVKLAISLHSPNQELRNQIMPVARAYPLEKLMQSIDRYVEATDNRIFYEYIMIKGLTDTPQLARETAALLKGRLAHVNLIPYNENPAIDLEESERVTIIQFKKILEDWGVTVTVRETMGREAKGACGQLGYEKVKK